MTHGTTDAQDEARKDSRKLAKASLRTIVMTSTGSASMHPTGGVGVPSTKSADGNPNGRAGSMDDACSLNLLKFPLYSRICLDTLIAVGTQRE